jgi:hypothetical protein
MIKDLDNSLTERTLTFKKLIMSVRELQDVKKVVTGMNQDTNPIDQPANSYRYALNMMSESREGDHSARINEEGNEACGAVKSGYQVIGSILINNNDVVLFSTNGTKSEIGILSESCTYTSVIESSCLNFSIDFPITGIYKIHNGCDRILYFTDNLNPLRSINLDNLIQYTNEATVADANTNDTWLCSLMRVDPEFQVPTIALSSVIDGGGSLERGTYTFILRYLDADFNPTDWTDFTQMVPVYGGNSSVYNNIDGGNFDLVDNDLFAEGKAIQLVISNLDANFPYYQLGVIQNTTGVIDEGAAYSLTQEAFNGTTATYTYTGAATQRTVEVLTDLTVDSIVFNKVKTIEQVNNRMILGNTTDDLRDWAEFQREASKVVLNWGGTTHAKSINNQSTPKSEDYVFFRRSYMRDEIYAFGIVYVFKDGTTSPVFHIPGRAPNIGSTGTVQYTNAQMVTAGNALAHTRNTVPIGENWDTQLLTVVAGEVGSNTTVGEADVKHIPITEFVTPTGARIGNQIERWKVYNTATDNQMSYYEGDTTYPPITDCSGVSIWGVDAWGNPLEGEPIRHHKFPDATLYPIHEQAETTPTSLTDSLSSPQGFINPMLVRISNVTIPPAFAADIQGYYLVRAGRDQQNKTVIDKGYFGIVPGSLTAVFGTGPTWFSPSPFRLNNLLVRSPEEDNPYVFISPSTTFTNELKQPTYFKSEYGMTQDSVSDVGLEYVINQGDVIRQPRNTLNNINSLGYIYVDGDTRQELSPPFTLPIENLTVSLNHYFSRWDRDATNALATAGAAHQYASAKVWIKPYSNLFNLRYQPTGELLTNTGTANHLVYGGDTFISELTWQSLTKGSSNDYGDMAEVAYGNFYVESSINSEVRSHGSLSYQDHLRRVGTVESFLTLDQFPDDDTKDYADNYFQYHQMYSQEPNFKQYFPLPITWDYCTECPNSFPYRLWYSNQSYQEQRADNYRTFLANNYQDLIGSSGPINNTFIFKDQLYAQTDYATWFIPTRPQELQTNEGTISIGTGGIFSVPPRRIETADRGYAGCQHRHTTVTSEFGTFWADADAGKVFLMQGKGPKDVTLKGMRNWFSENLPFNISNQLPNFNVDSHTSKNGVGLQAVFDPRHNRMILKKRDYALIGAAANCKETTDYSNPTPSTYGYNRSTGEYYTHNGTTHTIVDILSNQDLVEDKSWTVAFSLMGEYWDSFLTYKPDWMWNNRNNFFTFASGNVNLWKHGSRNYCRFYGNNPVPSVIDYIYNQSPYVTKVFNAIDYISKAENYVNGTFVEVPWDTWDHLWTYNSSQSSGFIGVRSKQDFTLSNPFIEVAVPQHTEANATNNENTFSVSEFYDMTINKTSPVVTNNWSNSAYRIARQSYGILDYPNSDAVDLTKNPFEIEPMRDKWMGARFWYNNSNGYKFTTEFVSNHSNVSFK